MNRSHCFSKIAKHCFQLKTFENLIFFSDYEFFQAKVLLPSNEIIRVHVRCLNACCLDGWTIVWKAGLNYIFYLY